MGHQLFDVRKVNVIGAFRCSFQSSGINSFRRQTDLELSLHAENIFRISISIVTFEIGSELQEESIQSHFGKGQIQDPALF